MDAYSWWNLLGFFVALYLVYSANRYLIRVIRHNREVGRSVFAATEFGLLGVISGILLAAYTISSFVERACG